MRYKILLILMIEIYAGQIRFEGTTETVLNLFLHLVNAFYKFLFKNKQYKRYF